MVRGLIGAAGVGYVRQASGGLFADDALRKADIRNNLTLSKRLEVVP